MICGAAIMSREKESKRTAYYLITTFIIITSAVATLEAYGVDTGTENEGREDDEIPIISNIETILDNISADVDRLLRPETHAKRNPIKKLNERLATTNRTDRMMEKRHAASSSKASIDKNRDKQRRSLFFRFFSDDTPPRKHRQTIISKGEKSDKIKNQDAFPLELTHLFPRIAKLVPDGNRSRWERTCDVCRRPQCHCLKSAGKFGDDWEKRSDAFDSERMMLRNGYRFDPLEEVFRDETESLWELDKIFDDVLKMDDDLFKMMPFSFTDVVVDEPNVVKIGSFHSGKEKHLRGNKINKTGNNLRSFIDSLRSKRQAGGKTISTRANYYKAALKGLLSDKNGNKRRVKKESELASPPPPPPSVNHRILSTLGPGPENTISDDKNNTSTINNINSTISKWIMEVNNSTEIKDHNPQNITVTIVVNKEYPMNSTENLYLDNETLVTAATALPQLVPSESSLRKKADDLNSTNITTMLSNHFDEITFDEMMNNLSMYTGMNTTDNATLETDNFNSTNITSEWINLFDEMNNYGGEQSAFQDSQRAADIKLKRDSNSKESKWHMFLVVLAVIPGIVGLVVVIGIAVIWVLQRRPTGDSGNESDAVTSQIPLSQQQPNSSVKC